jgi:hypothetical protein
MSQRELAQALSRPESTINKWANGSRPSPGNQHQVVLVLNELGEVQGLDPVSVSDVEWAGA